ncbi:armadillo-type protein [Mycotypha africana]|uniref:armadillo-type protein n=1 Tax=Mycotypha africana TaxID=64632 RepID=UPI0022FFE1B9|nr:armadillo-type protein [Mycotypha africana]KAI8981677.1 armadillo-type protein [Mycotypha africana]
MKLWPDIIKQLASEHPEVRKGTAWVCGTAVQNNPEAQKAFLDNQGLEPLLKLLKDENKEVRSKALYAVSGFLKHFAPGVAAFDQLNGFTTLHDMLKDPEIDPNMLRKVVFLYNSLIFDDQSIGLTQRFLEDGTFEDLQKVLVKYTKEQDDEDMVEKTLRTIHTLVTKAKMRVPDELKQHCKDARDKYGADNLALVEDEWKDLL